MCKQLKVFPVVVTEETADKVTVFCANKRNNPESNQREQATPGCFEFGDFIRAFKVSRENSGVSTLELTHESSFASRSYLVSATKK